MENLNINNAVIHALVKEQHQRIQPSRMKRQVLDRTHPAVIKTIKGVVDVYGTKRNSAHYGTFKTNEGRGDFPDAFEEYVCMDDGQPSDEQFLSLSNVAMARLYDKASSQTASSGGYILFADYSLEGQGRYFIIAMVKQKPGITLSDDLEPEELMHLDLARLNQAARIGYSRLQVYLEANPDDRADLGNYLSFVSPGSTKTASGYFVTALGCSEGTAAAQATKSLVQESKRFFRETPDLAPQRGAFTGSLLDYLARKEKSGTSVRLVEIEQIVREHIPESVADRSDDLVEALLARLNSDECAVPVEFPVSKSALSRLTQIRGGTESWSMTFDKGALGDQPGADVYYDRENDHIIVHNIPDHLRAMVLQELDSRNGD